MKIAQPNRHFLIGSCYFGCGLLVIVYVNLFTLYSLVREHLGPSFIQWAPLILPPVLLLFILFLWFFSHQSKNRGDKINKSWILLGIALCVFALFIPDPAIAVKKIHVTEYLILSLLARYTMSYKYSAGELFFFSSFFTALLGIHDEFLQGLHPSRTYGLRDMAVNIFSAFGGSCIWHGLQFFSTNSPSTTKAAVQPSPVIISYLFWLTVSIAALAFPLTAYLYSRLPAWPFLPLGASLVIWILYYPGIKKSHYHHGVSVLSCSSLLFFLYPPLVYVFTIPFY